MNGSRIALQVLGTGEDVGIAVRDAGRFSNATAGCDTARYRPPALGSGLGGP